MNPYFGKQFNCPLCDDVIGPHSRGVGMHARAHAVDLEALWLKMGNSKPTCACSDACKRDVSWHGWKDGYSQFAVGHFKVETRSKNATKQMLAYHWSRGKTRDSDKHLLEISKKTSKTLRTKYARGEIKHWSAGDANDVNRIIAKIVATRKKNYVPTHHWKFMTTYDIIHRIHESFAGRFMMLDDDIERLIDNRKNNRSLMLNVKCIRCERCVKKSIYGVIRSYAFCSSCDSISSSVAEASLADFVASIVGEHNIVRRARFAEGELDVYIPKQSFGIEYNGLYWHSDAVQMSNMIHDQKSKAFHRRGIAVMHVFEDEWRDRRLIVESMIKARLGAKICHVDARKCKIINFDLPMRRKFFNMTHIDGDVPASAAYSLVDQDTDDPVFALSLRKPYRSDGQYDFELARVAGALNTRVRGGFGRLFSHVRRLYPDARFLTHVDVRHGGRGRQYEAAGFKLIGETSPRFWWTDTINRFDRSTVTALGETSEFDMSILKRRLKIWGAANLTFSYT